MIEDASGKCGAVLRHETTMVVLHDSRHILERVAR